MKFVSILLLCLLPFGLFAQNNVGQKASEDFWRIQHRNVGSRVNLSYSQIQGTPYLNPSFRKGEIFTNGKLFGSYPLRYNIYSENFEFRKSDKEILELNMPGQVGKIKLGDTTYIYTAFKKKKSLGNGFLQRLNSGKAQGLIRYSVQFIKATPPGAYQDAEPARFSSIEKDYFVRFGKGPAVPVYKNSDFLKALPDHKQQVSRYMKKEKIRVSREKDLVKVLGYYNSL